MAKTESTAVNQLISSVQAGKPLSEPAEDLFSAPPPQPARVTSTVPPRGAAEVAPLPRVRAPSGTSQHQLPKLPPPVRVTTAPPPRPGSIPPLTRPAPPRLPVPNAAAARPSMPPPPPVAAGTPPPELVRAAAALPPARPSAPPPAPTDDNPFVARPSLPPSPSKIDLTGDAVHADAWFEPSRMVDRVEDEAWLSTAATPRTAPRASLGKKLLVAAGVLAFAGGATLVAYLATHHGQAAPATPAAPPVAQVRPAVAPAAQHDVTTAIPPGMATAESANAATASAGAEAPEPPAPAAPAAATPAAPAAAAATAPAVAAAPSPDPAASVPAPATAAAQLVDVRIDSTPAGATVMLVDNGKTSFLGTTPVSTSVDGSRAYDLILTLAGHPAQMTHFDPSKTHHVELALARQPAPARPAATAAAQPARPAHHHHAAASKPIAELADPGFDTPARPAASSKGTLMVSSKPPCSIYIDGRATGLVTPQRAIALSPGLHKITFVNADAHVKKTLAVSITADHPTKLIQNFMP